MKDAMYPTFGSASLPSGHFGEALVAAQTGFPPFWQAHFPVILDAFTASKSMAVPSEHL